MLSLFGIAWSPAIATMRLLKSGALKAPYLRGTLLKGIQEEIDKEVKKRKTKNQLITFEIFAKQIFKDKHYIVLYKELAITDQINTIIKEAISKLDKHKP